MLEYYTCKWLYFTLQQGLYCITFLSKSPPVWYNSSHEYDNTWRWNTETDETTGKHYNSQKKLTPGYINQITFTEISVGK